MPGKLMPALSWEVRQGFKLVALVRFPVVLSRMLLELSSNMVTNSQECVFEKTGRGNFYSLKVLAWKLAQYYLCHVLLARQLQSPLRIKEKKCHKSHESNLMNVKKKIVAIFKYSLSHLQC